ncbi:MAG: efflux RND transporter periplasmic adaptor subunit [Acidobacteriaceae bacterium]
MHQASGSERLHSRLDVGTSGRGAAAQVGCRRGRLAMGAGLGSAMGAGLFAAALGCLGMVGCQKTETTPEAVVDVQAAKPVVGAIAEQIQGDAVLSPLAEAALAAKVSAPVKKFYVQRGAHVHAGQLLVRLEDQDLEAAAEDNRGAYEAAQAAYQQATSVQLPAEMQTAELNVQQAAANLDLARDLVKNRQQLFEEGAIAGHDLDVAKAALVQAQAAYDTARQHLEGLRSVGQKAGRQVAEGDLTSARGKYLSAEANRSYAALRSPIDGVVTDRPLFDGEMATAGTPLVTVMDTSVLIAKMHLSQAMVQNLKVGDKAEVTASGASAPIAGEVSLISPALDPGSTTVEIWVKIRNPDGRLKAGTPVHVTIAGRSVPDALQVPASALLAGEDGRLQVMVVGEDNVAHLRTVTVGIRTAKRVQILSGVRPTDVVIDSGGYGLDDGTKVHVAQAGDGSGDQGADGQGDSGGGKS